MDQVPSGSRTPFPTVRGELPVDRPVCGIGYRSVQAPLASMEGPAQPVEVRQRASVTFDLPSGASPVAEEEEDDDRDSVVFAPLVADRTLLRLVNFIYGQYLESRPLSSPSLARQCGFKLLYAVSDPQETSRPHFHLYPGVNKLLKKTHERAATLAKNSKPLAAILTKKRRLHSVAEAPNFSAPLPLNPDFSRLAENKSVSRK